MIVICHSMQVPNNSPLEAQPFRLLKSFCRASMSNKPASGNHHSARPPSSSKLLTYLVPGLLLRDISVLMLCSIASVFRCRRHRHCCCSSSSPASVSCHVVIYRPSRLSPLNEKVFRHLTEVLRRVVQWSCSNYFILPSAGLVD